MQGADPRILDAAPGRGLTAARLLRAMLPGAAALLFGSHPLAAWADRLPAGWEPVQTAASWWDALMTQTGCAAPYALLHAWFRGLVEATF